MSERAFGYFLVVQEGLASSLACRRVREKSSGVVRASMRAKCFVFATDCFASAPTSAARINKRRVTYSIIQCVCESNTSKFDRVLKLAAVFCLS